MMPAPKVWGEFPRTRLVGNLVNRGNGGGPPNAGPNPLLPRIASGNAGGCRGRLTAPPPFAGSAVASLPGLPLGGGGSLPVRPHRSERAVPLLPPAGAQPVGSPALRSEAAPPAQPRKGEAASFRAGHRFQ